MQTDVNMPFAIAAVLGTWSVYALAGAGLIGALPLPRMALALAGAPAYLTSAVNG